MPNHEVKQGDCMASIADEYGLFWETMWIIRKTPKLKEKRKDPNILFREILSSSLRRIKDRNKTHGSQTPVSPQRCSGDLDAQIC